MTKPDLPKQEPTPDQARPIKQSPQNSMGDLALLAEFYAERFRQDAESASEGVKKYAQRSADEMARVKSILIDLANKCLNTQEADRMLGQLERDYFGSIDKAVSDEEAEENDRGLSAVQRAQTFLEKNRSADIHGRKDFSDWLAERNAHIEDEERKAEDQRRTKAERVKTDRRVEAVYGQIGVESPTEREKLRERAVQFVLQDGGVRIHTAVEQSLSPRGSSGFQNLETRIQDGLQPSSARGNIEGQFLSEDDSMRRIRLDEALEKRGIKEIIDIRGVKKEIYEEVNIPGRRGVFGIGKTPDRTEKRPTGRHEPELHSEIVSGGKNEPAVRFSYYISQKTEWRDYSGRGGQMMMTEIVLPESAAKEVAETLERDPATIRRIVERVMKEKLLKDPKAWETPQGKGDSLRPPYDKWDAESGGGKIYVQQEGMTPGFHEEALKRVQR